MKMRSLLFVPGDRPERMQKARGLGADILILDLEDSVATAKKGDARKAVADFLAEPRAIPIFVRVNAPAAHARVWVHFFISARSFFKDERQSI